jgi:hypothetical protein
MANRKLIQNVTRVSEIHLPDDDAPPEACQSLAYMLHSIGVLIERENVAASFQKRFAMTTPATRSVNDQKTWSGL